MSDVVAVHGVTSFQASGQNSQIKLDNVQTIDGHEWNDGVGFDLSNGGSINVPAVQSLTSVSATVRDGLTLNLSSATSYSEAGYVSLTFQAIGSRTRIDLSGVTTFAGTPGQYPF